MQFCQSAQMKQRYQKLYFSLVEGLTVPFKVRWLLKYILLLSGMMKYKQQHFLNGYELLFIPFFLLGDWLVTRIVLFPIFACPVSGEFHLCPHVNLHSRQADEYDCCFLGLLPYIAVVTNVDWEHVDIFPDEVWKLISSSWMETSDNWLSLCADYLTAWCILTKYFPCELGSSQSYF